MKTDTQPDPMRGVRRMLCWAVVPTAPYLVYAAAVGIELPSVSRRPGPYVPITWSETPVQFVFSGISVYAVVAVVMLIVYGVIRGLFGRPHGNR